jgi:N-acetylmuramic acid 6-phosphate etherase
MTETRQTEAHLQDVIGLDTWSNQRILETLMQGQQRALDAVSRALPAISKAADGIAARLSLGGRLFYAGAGSSVRIGVQDGSELPATFGASEAQIQYLIAGGRTAMFETLANAEDNAEDGRKQAASCKGDDAVIAIAASGSTPFTVAVAEQAKKTGCFVVAVVNNPTSPLGAVADVEILLDSGPEVIGGSTRMGAGTAQKIALNLMSTLVFVRLGAVYDGLMVNVRADNAKLANRAARMVAKISGAAEDEAAAALVACKGSVKAAVMLCLGAMTADRADRLLLQAKGNLRQALLHLKQETQQGDQKC